MTFREYVEKNKETILSGVKQSKKEMIKEMESSGGDCSAEDLDISGVWV